MCPRSTRCSSATSPTSFWSTTSVATCSSGVSPIASRARVPFSRSVVTRAGGRSAAGAISATGRTRSQRAGEAADVAAVLEVHQRRVAEAFERRHARRHPLGDGGSERPRRQREQDDLGAARAQRARHRVGHVAEPRGRVVHPQAGLLGDPPVDAVEHVADGGARDPGLGGDVGAGHTPAMGRPRTLGTHRCVNATAVAAAPCAAAASRARVGSPGAHPRPRSHAGSRSPAPGSRGCRARSGGSRARWPPARRRASRRLPAPRPRRSARTNNASTQNVPPQLHA